MKRNLRALALALALAAGAAACAPAVQPPGPGATAAALLPGSAAVETFVTADGTRLPLRRWLPEGPPRAVILGLHGFGDTANAHAMPAPASPPTVWPSTPTTSAASAGRRITAAGRAWSG